MLESMSDWPTRELIERVVIERYELLEAEKSGAGAKAPVVALERAAIRNVL